jgi:hypothetical protein
MIVKQISLTERFERIQLVEISGIVLPVPDFIH